MHNSLKTNLEATDIKIEDISGGCGSMYAILVESPRFHGISSSHPFVFKILWTYFKYKEINSLFVIHNAKLFL